MANTSNLKAAEQVIKDNIRPNGVQSITADVLKNVLLDVTEAALMDITAAEIQSSTMTENYVFGTDNYGDRTVTGDKIAVGTITGSNIADETINTADLAPNSVVTTKIKDYNVTHSKLDENSVWTSNILSGSVTNDKLADNSVATDNIINGNVTNEKLAEDAVGTTNIINESVTVGKLAPNSVGTNKIIDYAVTTEKLSDSVSTYLLTPDMKTYLENMLNEEKQRQAQALFNGTTSNGGSTTYIYGEVLPTNAKKTVSVNLTFSGDTVTADYMPAGWSLDGTTYSIQLSTGGTTSVPSTKFVHTEHGGSFDGITVEYNSQSGSVQWKYPIYMGYLPTNSASIITKPNVATMEYRTSNVSLSDQTLVNNLSTDAYYCVLTRGGAVVTQIGVSIMDAPVNAPDFVSTKLDSVVMSGYKAYFSQNTVSAGGSLDNVSLTITQ